MARFVRSHQQMQIFKTTTEPTVAANGLAVGDIWIDTTSGAISQVCTAVGPVVFKSELAGTGTNDSAAAGSVGELLTATASTVALTTVTTKNITSVSLTAGDWDVWGVIAFDKAAGTTVTQTVSWTSETSATLPAVLLRSESTHSATNPLAAGTRRFSLQPPVVRYSLSGTTTIYLSTYQDFSGSTLTVSGTIYARRRR